MSAVSTRVLAAGVGAVALWAAAQSVRLALFCGPHQAWEARQSGRTVVVLDRGERIARTSDRILLCESAHRTGPIVWHEDLECTCAPPELSPARVGELVDGLCSVEDEHPGLTSDTGSCRFARCTRYVDAE